MKKLSSTEAELKKSVAYKKKRVINKKQVLRVFLLQFLFPTSNMPRFLLGQTNLC